MSLEHTEWQDRKVNLIDVPGDPAFQGELRCAARVVEGALVTVSAVMGVETIGRMKGLSPRATPHRDGKVTYPPLYDLPPHTAQMTWIFPPPTTRMMTWPAVSVKHDHSGDVRASPTHSSRRCLRTPPAIAINSRAFTLISNSLTGP